MHSDPLAQSFVDGFTQGVIQVRLTAEYECKAVQGIIPVVHKHLDVLQDARGEVLGFVNGQKKGLLFLLVKVEDLLLYGPEHPRLTAFWLHAKDTAELAVELHDADGGETEVFHVVQVWIEPFGETAQAEGLAHAGTRGEQAYAPCVLEVIESGEHFRDIFGEETVFFPSRLFVERVKGEPIVRAEHQRPPPSFE